MAEYNDEVVDQKGNAKPYARRRNVRIYWVHSNTDFTMEVGVEQDRPTPDFALHFTDTFLEAVWIAKVPMKHCTVTHAE